MECGVADVVPKLMPRLEIRSRLRSRLARARARRLEARLAGPKLVRAFGHAFPEAVFIEIGANDGEQEDHLHSMITSSRWQGVMVEPVPYVFERLRANYAGVAGVEFANVAITDRDGSLPFYYLAPSEDYASEGLPQWYDGIGSFSREAVLDHARLIRDIEQRMVETTVPCLTFESLCAEHELDRIDLLLIDTEGHDFEILKHIDFTQWHPTVVIYEHFHLSPGDRQECRSMLESAGYLTLTEGFDTWCLHRDAGDDLLHVWRSLRAAIPPLAEEDEPR